MEKNKRLFADRERIVYALAFLICFAVVVFGISYAFMSAVLTGNETNTSITITSGELGLIFEDKTENVNPDFIAPGWSYSKAFRVINDTGEAIKYNIVFASVENTFVNTSDLTYSLIDTNSQLILAEGTIPLVSSVVLPDVLIPDGITYNYTLNMSYNNSGLDQTDDVGKTFSFSVKLTDAN